MLINGRSARFMRVRLTAETKPLRTLAKPRRVSGPRFPGQFLHDLEASIGKRYKPGFAVPRVTLRSSLVRDSSSPDRVNVQNACGSTRITSSRGEPSAAAVKTRQNVFVYSSDAPRSRTAIYEVSNPSCPTLAVTSTVRDSKPPCTSVSTAFL